MTKEQLENLRDKLRLRRQAFFPLYEDERYLVDLLAEVDRLTAENERLRPETVGWMYAYACNCVDSGIDIRHVEAPLILSECEAALEQKP